MRPVAGASRAILNALVDKSLVRATATGRYELHELLRQFAAEKLATAQDAENATRDAHSAYFADFLRACADELDGRRQLETLTRIGAELGNVHAAWERALACCDPSNTHLLCQGLFQYYLAHGDYHTGRALFEAAQHAFQREAKPEHAFVLARVMIRLAQFYHRLGRLDEAEATLTRARALLPPDAPNLASEKSAALNTFGLITLYRGKPEQARQFFCASRELAERADMPAMLLSLANNLAIVAGMQGDFAEAHRQFSQAAVFCEKIGDVRRMLAVVMNGGVAAHYLPDLAEAKRLLTRASELARELQDRENLALALSNLASVAIDARELAAARAHLDEAVTLIADAGSAYVQSAIWEEVARWELASGNVPRADAQARAALDIATAHRLAEPQLHALVTLAAIRATQDVEAAARIFAMVERHPARLSTVHSRTHRLASALPADILARARAWAQQINFDAWVTTCA